MIKKILNSIAKTIGKNIKNIRHWFTPPVITPKNSFVPKDTQSTQVLIVKTYRIIWETLSPDEYCSMPSLETKRIGFELLSNEITIDTSENWIQKQLKTSYSVL